MYGFNDVLVFLKNQFDVVTFSVFIIIFTIVYAIMDRTKIVGENKRGINALVSLVLATLFVVPHVTPGVMNTSADPVNIVANSVPNILVVIIAIFMFILLLAMFGIKEINLKNWMVSVSLLGLGIFVVFYAFGTAAGWFDNFGTGSNTPEWVNGLLNNSDFWSLVIIAIVFVIIIAVVVGPSENSSSRSGKSNKENSVAKGLRELFKGA
ncbi:MAG: hypothetical protein GWP09_01505 [Nitrospiraceae bacterium]|nr:hypothetical protein [Nitrospiraceae bacterium]